MAKQRVTHTLLTLTTASVLTLTLTASPAQAEDLPEVPQHSVALQSLLDFYPESIAIDENTVRVAPGVLVTLPKDYPRDKVFANTTSSEMPAAITRTAPPAQPTTSPAKAQEPVTPAADDYFYGCYYEHLCLYTEPNLHPSSAIISFYYCQFKDLGAIPFPGGGHWNDRISSWVNNQTPNTASHFYNWNGTNQWTLLFSSNAFSYNTGMGPYDNILDAVRVC